MTQPVLVTGGAGYIGSHVCKALAAEGHDLVVLDDLSGGHRRAVRWGPLEVADLRDAEALERIFVRHRPWAVMNFAGLIAVGESVREPARYYDVNVGGLVALLAAAQRHGVSAFVFSSSASVYGVPETTPIPEDSPMEPLSPYAWSKRMAEQMLADLGAAHGLRSAVLRYFNAAGADPEGELGEAHDPETHLIPLAIRAALDGPDVLSVFGDDYDTPDGTPIRDYIHVTDLAEAHVRALDRLGAGHPSLTVNLGTGTGYSVREVIAAVERASGRGVRLRQAPRRPGDAPALVADPSRAFDLLEWRPRLSDLDRIVETALAWERTYRAAAE